MIRQLSIELVDPASNIEHATDGRVARAGALLSGLGHRVCDRTKASGRDERLSALLTALDREPDVVWGVAGGTRTVEQLPHWRELAVAWDERTCLLGTSDLTHLLWMGATIGRRGVYAFDLVNVDAYFADPAAHVSDALMNAMDHDNARTALLTSLGLAPESRILGGHLMITTFMVLYSPMDLADKVLFVELHSDTDERAESVYWVDQLATVLEGSSSLPRAMILGHHDVRWGSTDDLNRLIEERIGRLGISTVGLDHFTTRVPIG